MNQILIVTISLCVFSGVLLLLSRDIFKMVMGLAVMGAAANLVLFSGGRPQSMTPAIIEQGEVALSYVAASPLPQALVLTAIVIGFALLCFALIVAAVVSNQQDSSDIADYQQSEPLNANTHAGKPAVMEAE